MNQPEQRAMGAESRHCSACGEERADVEIVVTPDGSERAMCPDCYADLIAKETLLSTREAQAYAHRLMGFAIEETAEKLDITNTDLREYERRATDKFAKAIEQFEEAQRTLMLAEQYEEVIGPIHFEPTDETQSHPDQ